MKRLMPRATAESYASWFRALADPTRVQVLHLLAASREPLTVGQVVERVGVAQSTVSHHLRILGGVGFVHMERVGTSSLFRVNERCLECFPTAADVVMGRKPLRPERTT